MAKKYITQDRLKKNTLADIFVFILEKKQTTRREIEYETGFSWGTVSANVAFLIEKGYITEEKSEQNSGAGRTTYILKPTSDKVISVGLDINISGLSCEIVSLNSQTIKRFTGTLTAKTQNDVITQSETLLKVALDYCNENELQVFSLGIAMQGSVNGRIGTSIRFPKIDDWHPYNIKEHFSKKFDLPVYLGHDPKCMLLGEMNIKKHENCVLVRVDDGIGMAVSLDGKIIDDTERLELGHTLAVPNGRRCKCGKCGCLESYASLSAISQTKVGYSLFDAPDRFEEELRDAGSYLAKALYNTYVLFKPEQIILSGKATTLNIYTESATELLADEPVMITIAPEISAAYGAAVESAKSAIRSFAI